MPTDVAREVARRVLDPVLRDRALVRLARATLKPQVNTWSPSGVSLGGAGLAIMCAEFDGRFPDAGWDVAAHGLLASGLDEVGDPARPLGLFSGAVGYAAAIWFASRGGTRYTSLLASLDAALLPRMRALALAMPYGPASHDTVNGVAGWVGYLLSRERTPEIDRVVGPVAEALAAVLRPDGRGRMAYRLGGAVRLDLGVAHGIAGPLAALALLEIHRGTGHRDTLLGAGRWLAELATWDSGCLLWPASVEPPGREAVENAGSWCHGSSGIARAVYLAGVATGSPDLVDVAVTATRTLCSRPPVLDSPNLCHGLAGQLAIVAAFARDTGDPLLVATAENLAAELADGFRSGALLGYPDVEQPGTETDNPGLLRGAAGVAALLLSPTPAWTRLLLLT
ncbi:lanthionine synthetase LanC family protein [Streptosporangium saharense]|uniref:Lantibiotic modifying enzyme n=1 Tax=Streptosporangium saharense TaxID=1706840 RepID=A0A7W7VP63_9ACTN|nr:lanthionine synthetase LanC family protein [Streptosporangium saharense]MBB4917189.1 lantibiotic modifying enzyme [Streptosporangium saharense]